MASDVWVAIMGAITALDISGNEELYPAVSGGSFVLKGYDCPHQSEHNNFEIWGVRRPGRFVLISGYVAIRFLGCSMSHSYLHHPITENERLPEQYHLAKAAIPAYSVFVRRGYQQHDGCDWWSFYSLFYYTNFVALSYNLKDAVASTKVASLTLIIKYGRAPRMRDGNGM